MNVYYVLLAAVIGLGMVQYLCFKNNAIAKAVYLIIVAAGMIYLAGNRFGRGFDYYTYIDFQRQVVNMSFSELLAYPMESGFMFFAKLVSFISTDPHMLYYATAFVVVGIACYIYFRYSVVPFISVLFFIVLNFYYNVMNSIRYALAMAIVMLAYRFIMSCQWDYKKEHMNWAHIKKDLLKNFIPYLLIILLAATFHKSALIMLPLYFMIKIPLNWKTGGAYAILTGLSYFIIRPLTYFFSDLFFHSNYSGESIYTTSGGSGLILPIILICIFIAFSYPRLIKQYPNALALVNLTIYSLVLFFIAAFSIFIYTRLTYYTFVFVTLLLPMSLEAFRPNAEEKEQLDNINKEMEILDAKITDPDDPEPEYREEYRELFKKRKVLLEKHKDEKAYYWFSLFFLIFLGMALQYRVQAAGDHKVFPYMSMSNKVNMFTNGIDESDREARARYMTTQAEFGWYLRAANDPDYVIILAGQGDLFMPNGFNTPAYTFAHLEPLEYFGLDTRLAGQYGQSYVAIGEAGNGVFQELSNEAIRAEVEIDGHEIVVISANKANGNYSSIKIDGVEYGGKAAGLNIVIFDKAQGKVVDSITYDLSS